MSAAADPPQVRFKKNAVEFSQLVADLIVRAHDNFVPISTTPVLLNIARAALESASPDALITFFIEKSYPHWEAIKRKDIDFFLNEGMIIFEALPAKNVEDLGRLFRSNIYVPTDKSIKMSAELYRRLDEAIEEEVRRELSKAKVKLSVEEQKRVEREIRSRPTITLSESSEEQLIASKQTFQVRPLIHPDIMEQMWTFFQGSCKQSVSYIHFRRAPDPQTKKYTQHFLPIIGGKKVSVKESTELWGITQYA